MSIEARLHFNLHFEWIVGGSFWMQKQEKATKVGNWATAESVPRAQFFDQARGKVEEKTPTDRNGQSFAQEGQLRPNPDTAKTEDSKPRRGNANDCNRESKPAERTAKNPTSDKRLASEGTPGRIRTKANTTVRYS